jgi:cytochrome c
MRKEIILLTLTAWLVAPGAALANSATIKLGRELAQLNCAKCHNIEKSGTSPFEAAPPFRTIPQKYDPSELEEAFVEGIVVGHPAMPEWEMTSEQATALAAFITSLAK